MRSVLAIACCLPLSIAISCNFINCNQSNNFLQVHIQYKKHSLCDNNSFCCFWTEISLWHILNDTVTVAYCLQKMMWQIAFKCTTFVIAATVADIADWEQKVWPRVGPLELLCIHMNATNQGLVQLHQLICSYYLYLLPRQPTTPALTII